jgi:hypothetical protein
MDSTPNRFADPYIRDCLDPITNIPGLSLTGQDTAICGVVLCQVSLVLFCSLFFSLLLFSLSSALV